MKHIVQFSGGKDSTCMLLMMLEKGMQVDEITFCDTGMEFPQMYDHIAQVENDISKKYGKHITTISAPHSYYYYMFNHVPKFRKDPKHDKIGFSWASMGRRWCTARMKVDVLSRYLRKFKGEDYIINIGIAYDEPKRHQNIPANIRHPLFEWGITEKMALSFCKGHGYTWGGLYDKFRRVSCWCCPLQPISELRKLYHDFPSLWQQLKDMDKQTWRQFRADYSVQDLEDKFKREDYLKKISIPLFDVTKYLE